MKKVRDDSQKYFTEPAKALVDLHDKMDKANSEKVSPHSNEK